MAKSFFSKRIALLGNRAVLVLCIVFFWLPFALRGARMAVEGMKNDVKDWLPADFPETKELDWFRLNFLGEQFAIVTWPGANADDPQFKLLVRKLRADIGEIPLSASDVEPSESSTPLDDRTPEVREEDEHARAVGDEHGLHVYHDLYENWSQQGEKWLRGDKDRWYYILPTGELRRWEGQSHAMSYFYHRINRNLLNDFELTGKYMGTFGEPPTEGQPNRYYEDPRRLTARFFHGVTTGPEVLAQLTTEEGPLWPRGSAYAGLTDEEKHAVAEEFAYERLTGVLFGPQPPPGFEWNAKTLPLVISKADLAKLPEDWETEVDGYILAAIDEKYEGDRAKLLAAPHLDLMRLYREMFRSMGVEPPHPQTCILVTLSKVGRQDLARVVGRPVMGKPRGRLLELATGECQIAAEDLKMGGPPIDNVAIDEEGTITLARLVSLSALVGLSLAYLCFRSVKITIMIFFVGGVSAMASLGIVWWSGSTVDAIVMTMPSLVYVLGLSGAVHIVNYYRDAVEEHGPEGAPERAISHGWFPCTLAAFTTALGLLSLFTSNIQPIKKFGLFSAVGVMATVILLFTYLPAALELWPGSYKKRKGASSESLVTRWIEIFWSRFGVWIVANHWKVIIAMLSVMIAIGIGLTKIQTSVQLLKLFDGDAKIIRDYEWLETHLGRLVPMELVVRVDREAVRNELDDEAPDDSPAAETPVDFTREDPLVQYDFLERIEMIARVKLAIETEFGDDGQGILGAGMAVSTFAPELPSPNGGGFRDSRKAYNRKLEGNRSEFLASDYLREDLETTDELLRLSLRLGALNNVDYGMFVNDLKSVVEPILSAHRTRTALFHQLLKTDDGLRTSSVLVLGASPHVTSDSDDKQSDAVTPAEQTELYIDTLDELLRNRGFREGERRSMRVVYYDAENTPEEQRATQEQLAEYAEQFDAIVVVRDEPNFYDAEKLQSLDKIWIDGRDHLFSRRAGKTLSAADRKKQDDPSVNVSAIYSGVVPVVYKAQRTLLWSLIESIGLAFVLIAAVMMILLRDWSRPFGLRNSLNSAGGMISMIPNVFPVVIIFGVMGHLGILVDIGSMMTASVAMGVAVDDTIHFLNWFRMGIRQGLSRRESIALAYRHCATAMTQTTAIGGLGLAVFGFSTFTPTQRFGILMLALLVAALIGDLILLPALLASPLGRFFSPSKDEALAKENQKAKA